MAPDANDSDSNGTNATLSPRKSKDQGESPEQHGLINISAPVKVDEAAVGPCWGTVSSACRYIPKAAERADLDGCVVELDFSQLVWYDFRGSIP